jgi:tRNA pseudouridine synthase 10
MNDQNILELAQKTLDTYHICDACLGRTFKEIKRGIHNKEKGKLIRRQLSINRKIKPNDCWLCEGLLDEINHFAHLVLDTLKEYDYNTFLIGSKIDDDILKKEKEIWEFIKTTDGEPIKMEINREVGKIIERDTKKIVDFLNPDIMVVIDTSYDIVTLQIKSLYIYGRYKKFKRGIPQTKWPCKICRGKGCKTCGYTGKTYDTSVEELVSHEALDMTKGTDESFHGSGREDVDAIMVGNGRPFVLEIKNPKKKTIDLRKYEKKTNAFAKNQVEVGNVRFSDKKEVIRIKDAAFKKVYRIVLEGEKPINIEKLKEVAKILHEKIIRQVTPTRVAHRRANKIRERKIYRCEIESVKDTVTKMIIETDSGMYIKEFISGDNGKTKPNLSEMINIPCIVKELDVIEIKGE